jgi:hypothetical protein
MKKEVITVLEICDDCQQYPIRYKCKGCDKAACHNCVRSFIEFQRRVKTTSLNTIVFCPECMKKDIPLIKQLQFVEQLRNEWWALVDKYEHLAEVVEAEIEDIWNE